MKQRRNNSFTAIETIVVIGIFTLLALMIIGWQQDLFSLQNIFSGRLMSQEEIRDTFKNLVAEVRAAQISNLGAYPLEQTNADSFIFYSDRDSDGLKERIRYFMSSGTLKRGIIKPTGQPLTYNLANEKISEAVHHVINPNNQVFTYYDENYTGSEAPLPSPVDITSVRLIKITLTVDENINRLPAALTETAQVSIRNLKDNL